MLNKVYSENPNLEVILYDMDTHDPDESDDLLEGWEKVKAMKLPTLLDHE